jgi:transposase InsO family protein
MSFLEDRIITRYGDPTKIITNNTKAFISLDLEIFFFKYGIVLSHSSNYYPQGNGLVESSNKNLMNIVKRIVGENKKLGIVRSTMHYGNTILLLRLMLVQLFA